MVSYIRAKQVYSYYQNSKEDLQATCAMFNLNEESVMRYNRVAREGDRDSEGDLIQEEVLVLDIETAPMLNMLWRTGQQWVGDTTIETDWYMLTWSAKWLGDDQSFGARLSGEESLRQDDSRICESLAEVLERADVVIAHNGNKFDIPKINTRLLINGILPPSPYKQIDTLKSIKAVLSLSSYKLDYICQYLGIGGKTPTGFELWRSCYNGDDDALEQMFEYNLNDVKILEDVYMKTRQWYKSHPPLYRSIDGSPICPLCGSRNLKHNASSHGTKVSKFSTFKCECGYNVRGRRSWMKSPSVVGM